MRGKETTIEASLPQMVADRPEVFGAAGKRMTNSHAVSCVVKGAAQGSQGNRSRCAVLRPGSARTCRTCRSTGLPGRIAA